jgi:hypothetical protein
MGVVEVHGRYQRLIGPEGDLTVLLVNGGYWLERAVLRQSNALSGRISQVIGRDVQEAKSDRRQGPAIGALKHRSYADAS